MSRERLSFSAVMISLMFRLGTKRVLRSLRSRLTYCRLLRLYSRNKASTCSIEVSRLRRLCLKGASF